MNAIIALVELDVRGHLYSDSTTNTYDKITRRPTGYTVYKYKYKCVIVTIWKRVRWIHPKGANGP